MNGRFWKSHFVVSTREHWSTVLLIIIGIISGISVQLNRLTDYSGMIGSDMLVSHIAIGVIVFPILLWGIRKIIRRVVDSSGLPASVKDHYQKYDTLTYTVFLLTAFRSIGVQFLFPVVLAIIFIFLLAQLFMIYCLMTSQDREQIFSSLEWLTFLFLISGFAALIYQVVWQRSLFTAFGVNIESITVIVSIFMFGLGIGALVGGLLSRLFPSVLPQLFLAFEIVTGIFGIISLPLIKKISDVAVHGSIPEVSLAMYALLSIPTMLMGATLPVLVTYLHRYLRNVGKSVGILYFMNTIGSAIACFVTVDILFVFFGQQVSVFVAALCNFTVGILVYAYTKKLSAKMVQNETLIGFHLANANKTRSFDNSNFVNNQGIKAAPAKIGNVIRPYSDQLQNNANPNTSVTFEDEQFTNRHQIVRFSLILLLSGVTGYISLSQEIIWVRAISFATGDRPDVFAYMLGFFLLGIAYGSLTAKKVCEKGKIHPLIFVATMLFISSLLYYFSIPISSRLLMISGIGISILYIPVGITSFFIGGIFPMLCHFGIRSEASVGFSLSWVYFANILGSTAGPLLTGFMLLNSLTLEQNILYLCVITLSIAGIVWLMSPISRIPKIVLSASVLCGITFMFLMHNAAYSQILEKMFYKNIYPKKRPFKYVIQNRVGILTVEGSKTDIIYGGGVYDGQFNLDPVLNTNGIRRAYIIAALHPDPQEVLEIGLSSGSWSRVIANHTAVRKLTVVEINPGYIDLIRRYPEHATILNDPKIKIFIDDGRRWLSRHPDSKFDVIVWNASFNWRNFATNTLSEEFLRLCKNHLRQGGVIYYNTTGSKDIPFTASHVFKFLTQYDSFLAASDRPFAMTPDEKYKNLLKFQNSGKPVFDRDNDALGKVLEELVAFDQSDKSDKVRNKKGLWHITDDNMATEFKTGNRCFNPEATWAKTLKKVLN